MKMSSKNAVPRKADLSTVAFEPHPKQEFVHHTYNALKTQSLLHYVRAYCERRNIEQKMKGGYPLTDTKMHKELAEFFGKSVPIMKRMLKLLGAPIEVQNAYEAEQLPEKKAEKVVGMRQNIQMEIATRIRYGEDPESVVEEYLDPEDTKDQRRKTVTRECRSKTKKMVEEFQANPVDMLKYLLGSDLEWTEQAQVMFGKISSEIKSRKNPWQSTASIVENMKSLTQREKQYPVAATQHALN
jgi:hypothetical protein